MNISIIIKLAWNQFRCLVQYCVHISHNKKEDCGGEIPLPLLGGGRKGQHVKNDKKLLLLVSNL